MTAVAGGTGVVQAAEPASDTAYVAHTRVSLLHDRAAVAPGETLRVGVYFEPDPGWHVYWLNPGDSGEPPRLQWRIAPEPSRTGPLRWPYPSLHETPPLATYVYERPTLLERSVTVSTDPGTDSTELFVRVDWLACSEICIPGTAELRSIVGGQAPVGSRPDAATIFAGNTPRVPDSSAPIAARVSVRDRQLALTFEVPDAEKGVTGLRYYPAARDLIDHAAPQTLTQLDARRYRLSMPLAVTRRGQGDPGDVSGVLVVSTRTQGSGAEPAVRPYAVVAASGPGSGALAGSLVIGVLAFAGGLLLNLMPCVLPVLSLKVLRLAQGSSGRIDVSGLAAYAGGVIGSFVLVGASVIALKALGIEAGWGFQMQSPVFILILIQIFILVGAGLVREYRLPAIAGVPARMPETARSAWEGVLSVLAATPCIAPFMGSAVGYALSAGSAEAMTLFALMGSGYCAPVLLLATIPALRARLPRPGPWMEHLKRCMLLPVALTLGWLAWVLFEQVSARTAGVSLALMVAGSVLLLSARGKARAALVLSALVCLGGAYTMLARAQTPAARSHGGSDWAVYDASLLRRSLEQGRAVFIDFTAAWCLTCQVNKRLVLDTPEADRLFERTGVMRMRADWTTRDEAISRQLRSYGRSGVPLYALYRPGSERPTLLPELLTPGILRDALEGAAQS